MMKNNTIRFFCLLLGLSLTITGTAQGFPGAYSTWSLPVGGLRYSGVQFGYTAIGGSAYFNHDNNSETWSLVDMDGDGLQDLVVTASTNASTQEVKSFSPNSNPYWKVYRNNGAGFQSAYTTWSLPIGGRRYNGIHLGYHAINETAYFSDDNNSESWSLVDMNGDAKPDLVVTASCNSTTQQVRGFSPASNPYWKVYLNNGSGFASGYTAWSLPIGGNRYGGVHYGYNVTAGTAYFQDDNNSESWSLVDMNGDALPDLVVTASCNSSTQQVKSFSPGSNPYWKVFINTGTGFAGSYATWSLPVGGNRYGGVQYGYNVTAGTAYFQDDNNSESWSLVDLTGDAKPDLVVTASCNSSTQQVKSFSPSSNPYWKVYTNTGSGFPGGYANWSLPVGGNRYGGVHYGYNVIAGNAYYLDDNNSESWSLADLDGDSKPDLVVTASCNSSTQQVRSFSPASNPYWKYYRNNGNGFPPTYGNWSLPIGGTRYNGVQYGYNGLGGTAIFHDDNNSESWSVTDMNGDHQPDLVVTASCNSSTQEVKSFSPASNPYWKVYLQTTVIGVQDGMPTQGLSVYPNPTADFLKIAADGTVALQDFRVMDVRGRTILQGRLQGVLSELDVRGLSPGTYFLRVQGAEKATCRFVKQ